MPKSAGSAAVFDKTEGSVAVLDKTEVLEQTEEPTKRPEQTDTAAVQKNRAREAHRRVIETKQLSFEAAVRELVDFIGAPLVVFTTGVSEPRAVRQWISGERRPHPTTQSKILLALQVASYLHEEGEDGAITAWFQGLNPELGDQVPAELIRDAERTQLSSVGRRILAAARAFANK